MADNSIPGFTTPQPIGVFPLPAGYLLIGDGPGHDDARTALVEGRRPELPASLHYYELALGGDPDAALAAIDGTSTVDEINRLVLDPTPARHAAVAAAVDDPGLATFVATIAYITGLVDSPPAAPQAVPDEFAALVHLARASAAMETHDRIGAVEELEAAAQAAHSVSKPMAGQILGQLANAQLDDGGTDRAAVTFDAALDALSGTDLPISQAELHVAAGAMYQEMSEAAPRLMQKAINHYHQAMALVTAETAPETFAIANANLGLAYMMMPMIEASDQLRVGVAVQSMRAALDYFTPQNHPDRWSSTQINLANALVYMPSKHQADNLAEAIGLYEGVLQHRDGDRDPQGRARVLANQGNALAHLGAFDDARVKLNEAKALFEEFDEAEAAATVRHLIESLDQHQAELRSQTS